MGTKCLEIRLSLHFFKQEKKGSLNKSKTWYKDPGKLIHSKDRL